jgi:Fic family protein
VIGEFSPMKSFEADFLERQPVSQNLLRTVALLGEYKGRQALHRVQSPQVLRTLQEAAVIQSTEASNRIEGVIAPSDRIRELVARRTEPRNRSEQEIAGYRDVLATIHVHYDAMEVTPNVVLQLHRDLFQFVPAGGGRWKSTNNTINETAPDGTTRVRFARVDAHLTADAMRRLHEGFAAASAEGKVEPLVLVTAYVLDFLCIHPFLDGNGRMARLLSLLLLYKAGHDVGRYISLEAIVEQTKDSYYDTLHASSQRWHEGEHDLAPWGEYFLGVMLLGASREFEQRVGVTAEKRGVKRELIADAVRRLPRTFRYADVERLLPAVSRPTINRALREMRLQGAIRVVKAGRDATWEKMGAPAT